MFELTPNDPIPETTWKETTPEEWELFLTKIPEGLGSSFAPETPQPKQQV